jgi:hypothetical protein
MGSAMGEAKMKEPEGGFSSTGLASMFERLAGDKEKRSKGPRVRPLMILIVAMLVFCTS